MVLKLKNAVHLKIWQSALLAAALALPVAASAQGYGNANTPPEQPVQAAPEVTPQIPNDFSMPADCKVIDDELALIEKFSHNPKATKTQLDANAKRADKLKANRQDLQCPASVPAK